MPKKLFVIFTIFAVMLALSANLVLAKNDKEKDKGDIPEIEGTYDVPGHPELKVKVFVYKAKPDKRGKPTPPAPEKICDLADASSTAIVSATPWKLPPAFNYYLNSNSVPDSVGSNNLNLIASSSFKAWTDAVNNKVALIKSGETAVNRKGLDGQSIVAWGRTSGSALAVTYVWYYPDSGIVAEMDTIMNKKFSWTWSEGISTCAYTDSYDAQSIMTHEFGHWFGLDDEYAMEYENNTMYGYGSKQDAKGDTLTAGDIQGALLKNY